MYSIHQRTFYVFGLGLGILRRIRSDQARVVGGGVQEMWLGVGIGYMGDSALCILLIIRTRYTDTCVQRWGIGEILEL